MVTPSHFNRRFLCRREMRCLKGVPKAMLDPTPTTLAARSRLRFMRRVDEPLN